MKEEEEEKSLLNDNDRQTLRNLIEDINKYGERRGNSLYLKGPFSEMKIGEFSEMKIGEKKEPSKEDYQRFLKDVYEMIIELLRKYVDLREEYYSLAAIWIIGTYFHDSFSTYPYLFINAMRGSGKSRLLNLIASISRKGAVIGSPTEAVLFRAPAGETLCLDEYEGITRKGNEGLREILNASYKKGMTIRRMKQKKVNGSNEQVVEEFQPYRPICMANIWGMEEVLGDRCITLILEKSQRKDVMRIIEDFSENPTIKAIKSGLEANLVYMCSYFGVYKGIYRWNFYVKSKYTTLHTLITETEQTSYSTPEINNEEFDFFNKIDATGINGRNLELFFPLLMIGRFIGEEVLEKILQVSTVLTKEKREDEMVESKDVSLFDFVSHLEITANTWKSVRALTIAFRNFLGEVEDKEDKWINEKWMGRALKRLNLIIDKRRLSGGYEVTLNIKKAREKLEVFR